MLSKDKRTLTHIKFNQLHRGHFIQKKTGSSTKPLGSRIYISSKYTHNFF